MKVNRIIIYVKSYISKKQFIISIKGIKGYLDSFNYKYDYIAIHFEDDDDRYDLELELEPFRVTGKNPFKRPSYWKDIFILDGDTAEIDDFSELINKFNSVKTIGNEVRIESMVDDFVANYVSIAESTSNDSALNTIDNFLKLLKDKRFDDKPEVVSNIKLGIDVLRKKLWPE